MMELIATHRKAAADYLEYRREVEGIAAEFAARRATDDDRALLDRHHGAHAGGACSAGDFEEEAAIDVEFHNAIGECAHNIMLLHTLRSCYRLLSDGVFHNRLMVFALPGAREELLAQHRAIHDAVAARRSGGGARRRRCEHIDYRRARHGGGRALRRLAARLAAEAEPAIGGWGWRKEGGEQCGRVVV